MACEEVKKASKSEPSPGMGLIPEFPGDGLGLDIAETLLLTRWPERQRRLEPKLFQSKDWDERHRHPVVSTYRFAHLFTTETRIIIRAHVDDTPPRVTASGRVLDWNPIAAGDIFAPPASEKAMDRWRRKIGSVIRARQWADQHGIPYRYMIRASLRAIYFDRGYLLQRTALPDPGLLNGEQMRDMLLLGWVEQLEARIQHGGHPRYLLASHDRHPDIAAHRAWLIQQIRRRGQPHLALSKFMRLGLLDAASVEGQLPPGVIARAVDLCA